jgi:hypothetical protein
MDDTNRANLLTVLYGILMGAFAVGLALSGSLGATALTFVLIVLVLILILSKFVPTMNMGYVLGIVIGAGLVILMPALSPAALEPVQLLLIVVILWLMGK